MKTWLISTVLLILTLLISAIITSYLLIYQPIAQPIHVYRDQGAVTFQHLSASHDLVCLLQANQHLIRRYAWQQYVLQSTALNSLASQSQAHVYRPIQIGWLNTLWQDQDFVYLWLRCTNGQCSQHTPLFAQPVDQLTLNQFAQLIAFEHAPTRYHNDHAAWQQRTQRLIDLSQTCRFETMTLHDHDDPNGRQR